MNISFGCDITRQERSHMEGKWSVEMARHSYPSRLIYPSPLVLNFLQHIHERIHICNNSRAFLYLITVQTSSDEIKCNFTHSVYTGCFIKRQPFNITFQYLWQLWSTTDHSGSQKFVLQGNRSNPWRRDEYSGLLVIGFGLQFSIIWTTYNIDMGNKDPLVSTLNTPLSLHNAALWVYFTITMFLG